MTRWWHGQLEEKNTKRRSKIRALEAEVQTLLRENAQLESFRQLEASTRVELHEQLHVTQRLQKDMVARAQEVNAANTKLQQSRAQNASLEKQQHRQEAKVRQWAVWGTLACQPLHLCTH